MKSRRGHSTSTGLTLGYLLWRATLSKGDLTKLLASGAVGLQGTAGQPARPTARRGGGEGGGEQGGGGGGSGGGRTSREKGTLPLALRAVPWALREQGGAISTRERPVDS